jgi:hypothetical protein
VLDGIEPDFDYEHAAIKSIYWCLMQARTSPPRCLQLFPGNDFRLIFANLHNTFIDPVARDICYKLIMQVLPVLHRLSFVYKCIPASQDVCSFCRRSSETYEHLFYYCSVIAPLRKLLRNYLLNFGVALTFDKVYLLNVRHKNNYEKALILFLCSNFIKTIWVNRNFIRFDHRVIKSDALIMHFASTLKVRILCDFKRFVLQLFEKFWCSTDLFVSVVNEELEFNFDI